MKKQTLILFFIGIFALFLGIFFSFSSHKRFLLLPAPTPTPVFKPSFPFPSVEIIPDSPKEVSFTYSGSQLTKDFLPLYRFLLYNKSPSEIAEIGKLLGFFDPAVKKHDKNNTVYSWTTPFSSLSLFDNGSTQTWNYALSLAGQGARPVGQTAEAGKNYLMSLFSLPDKISLLLKKESSGPFDGVVLRDTTQPALRGYYFSFVVENSIPIVSSTFGDVSASVLIDSRGVVRSFSFTQPLAVQESGQFSILSPSESFENIKSGNGELISFGLLGDYSFIDSPLSFLSVILSSFSFVYYPDTITTTLVPFYIFEGTTKNTAGETLRVSYTVSAVEKR